MTRRARAIVPGTSGTRLPVPPADDEISRLGDTLNAMLDRQEEALEHERAFVADASHELRAPLAIMSAEIHVALQTARDVDAFRLALESLAVENDRVVRLAENLLVLARADQRRLPLRPELVDVAEYVMACAVALRRARRARRVVRIEHDVEPDLFARADEVRLGQLLDNLVDNALRYAKAVVTVSARRDGAGAIVRVSDDGPGFPPDFVARAFDRFAVADDSRTGQHTGLGLAIARGDRARPRLERRDRLRRSTRGHRRASPAGSIGVLQFALTVVQGRARSLPGVPSKRPRGAP